MALSVAVRVFLAVASIAAFYSGQAWLAWATATLVALTLVEVPLLYRLGRLAELGTLASRTVGTWSLHRGDVLAGGWLLPYTAEDAAQFAYRMTVELDADSGFVDVTPNGKIDE